MGYEGGQGREKVCGSIPGCCCCRSRRLSMRITANPLVVSFTLHPTAPLCVMPLKPENPLLNFFQRMKPWFFVGLDALLCRAGERLWRSKLV